MSCECGCGEEAKPGNRFIHGHQWKINKTFKDLIRTKNDGRFKFSAEFNKTHKYKYKRKCKRKFGEEASNFKDGRSIYISRLKKELIELNGHKCEITGISQEEHLKKFKGKGINLHHVDGDKMNNTIKNGILLSVDVHSMIRDLNIINKEELKKYLHMRLG